MAEILDADEHIMEFMKTQVRERKAEVGSTIPTERKAGTTQSDVFTMLVKANEDEGGKYKLDDDEVVRWTFLQSLFFCETLFNLRYRLAMSSL
jgi:cytochrome P450